MKHFLKSVFLNLYLLLFLNGILLATAIYLKAESNYEDALFTNIVEGVIERADPGINVDSFFLGCMRVTHTLEENRQKLFGNKRLRGLKAEFLRPAAVDLMTGNGACGSYSVVLARILKAGGYQVRIAQMQVDGLPAGHMVVEAKKRSDWVVLDPMFNQYFKKPNGSLASFNDVKNNWSYYQKQTVPGYETHYVYENVRYTNWQGIPIIGNAIKTVLSWMIGKEKTEQFSLRSFILRKYNVLFWVIVSFYSVSCALLIWTIYRKPD